MGYENGDVGGDDVGEEVRVVVGGDSERNNVKVGKVEVVKLVLGLDSGKENCWVIVGCAIGTLLR